MHTYLFHFRVEGVGMAEETISAYSVLDAQKLIRTKYSPAKVTIYSFRQLS
jgi:hypothetical protein